MILPIILIVIILILLVIQLIHRCESYKEIPLNNNSNKTYTSHRVLKLLGVNNNKQPSKRPNINKIISFEWDCAGFNNVRMAFEVACSLAIIFDRTIVLPPKHHWDHMPTDSKTGLEDFYDIDTLSGYIPILSANEYMGQQVSYHVFTDIMASRNGLSKEILSELPLSYKKLSTKQEESIWFFLSCKKDKDKELRIFGNFNSIFRDSPHLPKIRSVIKNGIKFRSDLLNMVPSINPGSYDAVHARLGDFQQTFEKNVKDPLKKLHSSLLKILTPQSNHRLLIITSEKDKTKFDSLKNDFDIFFLNYHPNTPDIWIPIIDILSCVSARRFVGNKLSTFTYYIQLLRGYCVTNKKFDLSTIIDDSPGYHNKRDRVVAKLGKNWNCKGSCWDILDTEQWLDPELEEHSVHFPLTKTAFYINLDKDTSRNSHIQTLLNSIGFENIN